MRLKGKVALITGAGSGIGRATALLFAREGATVVCAGLHQPDEEATAEAVRREGDVAEAVRLDVASEPAVVEAIDNAIERFGALHVLMNNAGIGGAPWAQTVAVNLSGVYYGLHHGAARMAEAGGGSIINVSSILGLVGTGQFPEFPDLDAAPYVASKHGIVGLTRAYAISYARRGVRVNCICPGYIETPMVTPLLENPAIEDYLKSLHPIGRLGKPDEVAHGALFLASDEASFITGTTLVIDGGYTAQ